MNVCLPWMKGVRLLYFKELVEIYTKEVRGRKSFLIAAAYHRRSLYRWTSAYLFFKSVCLLACLTDWMLAVRSIELDLKRMTGEQIKISLTHLPHKPSANQPKIDRSKGTSQIKSGQCALRRKTDWSGLIRRQTDSMWVINNFTGNVCLKER